MEKQQKGITRKDFLKGMGTTIAGVTVLGGMGSVLAGCEDSAVVDTASASSPEWPFPYQKLDGEKVAERAYNAYKEKGG